MSRLILAAVLSPTAWAATPPDAIAGTWLTEDGGSRVEISAAKGADGGAVHAGKVACLKEPRRDGKPVHDASNSAATLHDRPILGLEILSGFKAAPGGGWAGGTIYSPRAGKSYPAELAIGGGRKAAGQGRHRVEDGLLDAPTRPTRHPGPRDRLRLCFSGPRQRSQIARANPSPSPLMRMFCPVIGTRPATVDHKVIDQSPD